MANNYILDHGFVALTKELEKLDGTVIRVGIQADAETVEAVDDKGRPSGVSLLDKAIFNEFGTSGRQDSADAGHGPQALPRMLGSVVLPSFELGGSKGNGGAIPARPFVSGWADTKADEIYKNMQRLYTGVLDGKYSAAAGAAILGEWAQGSIKKNLRDYAWTPNAPATIKAKGSSKPLIDVSQMVNALRYLVTTKGETE